MKNILLGFLALTCSTILSGCGEDQETLDSAKLDRQCKSGYGYSCYKLATMHADLNIFPNTLDVEPDVAKGLLFAKDSCEYGDNYGCSLYYNFIGEGISINEAVEKLTQTCSTQTDGAYLSCATLVDGSFIPDKAIQSSLMNRAYTLSLAECLKGEKKSGQACYFASKKYVNNNNWKDKIEVADLLFKACDLSKNYNICKESAETYIKGDGVAVNYELYEKSVNNALSQYLTLCETRSGSFCGEYIEKGYLQLI